MQGQLCWRIRGWSAVNFSFKQSLLLSSAFKTILTVWDVSAAINPPEQWGAASFPRRRLSPAPPQLPAFASNSCLCASPCTCCSAVKLCRLIIAVTSLNCVQIQTVKTQEMNLLREQQEALTAELQQRRADQEALMAQKDDLNSQLQVRDNKRQTWPSTVQSGATHPFFLTHGWPFFKHL